MALKSRIEAELLSLSSANFQKLCDTYLRYNKAWELQSWGAMVGADKDKTGVPDAYCRLPEGQYILVAYTTTSPKKLPSKLADDLADCITEAQAELKPAEIECIVLVFNNVVSLRTTNKLVKQATASGYKLILISLNDMVEMVLAYPGLAGELINLDLGRGELLQGPDFVAAYGRQRLATPLSHALYGRDTEQHDFREKLAANEVVLVTGPAGVGKTQLVVTTCQAYFSEDPENRRVYYVYDKGPADFSKELQFMLTPGKAVVIVVDDANRISRYLDTLIREQRVHPAGALKIVVTVRDYARDIVQRLVQPTCHTEVELAPLANEHITALLNAEPYNIRHHRYLERILELSAGRPRLAIMVASAAKEAQRLEKLNDIADIYDLYFGPILEEIAASPNPHLLKVAALIYFFRVVRQDDAAFAGQIEHAFGITAPVFWECTKLLHNAELVEVYEDRLVRTSDQILGNYIFYQVFFGSRSTLSYASLLLTFFAAWHRRAADTFVSVINDFNYEALRPKIAPALATWLKQPVITDETRWLFFSTFWPYLRTEILSYAQQYLDGLPWLTKAPADYQVETSNHLSHSKNSPVLEALERLCLQPVDEQASAIQLVIELAAKLPEQFNESLQLLKKLCSFNTEDYERFGLQTLTNTLNVLSTTIHDPEQGEFGRWLLQHIIPSTLATSFSGSRASREANSILLCTYNLPFQEDAKQWRQQLWIQFSELCDHNPALTVKIFSDYLIQRQTHRFAAAPDGKSEPQWQKWDVQYALPLIESHLDPANFTHCKLANQYYHWLERTNSIPEVEQFRSQFTEGLYKLYDLLVSNQRSGRRPGKDELLYRLKEPEKYFRERLSPLMYNELSTYQELVDKIHALHATLSDANERHQVNISFTVILQEVMERQPELGTQVIAYWLSVGNPMSTMPWHAIKLLATLDYEAGYHLLNRYEYEAKNACKWLYLHYLPANLASDYWLRELYQVAETGLNNYDLDGLEVYQPLTANFYPDLLSRALDYAESTTNSLWFNSEMIREYGKYFPGEHLNVLKRLYEWLDTYEEHADYEGEQLAYLLEYEPEYLLTYARRNLKKEGLWVRYDSRQLRFFWKSDKYHPQLFQILEELAAHNSRFDEEQIAKSLFPAPEDEAETTLQDNFLCQAITRFHNNQAVIQLLFSIIREQFPKLQIHYLSVLIPLVASKPELLTNLSFFPLVRSADSGSWIPVHQEDQAFWRSVINLIDAQPKRTTGLLKYRTTALQQISYLDKAIAEENERIFASPY
ncbi:MAG: ATP-binding protein [Hymenobacter sp.]|nr:MAG: ATP-binding protein [Hymenobacter sp.]